MSNKSKNLFFPALNKDVGTKMKVVENKESNDIRFIDYKEIMPNPLNQYPIEDIEKLAESIKKGGLLHNLVLVKLESPVNGCKYKIISGERRYNAIKYLIENGDSSFTKGICSKIIHTFSNDSKLEDIEEEILLIEANEEVRESNQSRKREMIARLECLYNLRSELTGEKKSHTKEISEKLGMGERQVQRYKAVNTLIPELTEAFDKGNLNLEKAAGLSKLSEDAQKIIASFLGDFKSTEIDLLKKEAEKLASEKEQQTKLLNEKIQNLTEKYEKEQHDLEVLVASQELQLKEIENEEKKIREEIEEQVKNKNDEKLKILEQQLEQNKKDKDILLQSKNKYEQEKQSIEEALSEKNREINNLKKKLKEHSNNKLESLSKSDQQKLTLKFELQNIVVDIKKMIVNLMVKSNSFHKMYQNENSDIDESIKELKKYIDNELSNL